MTPEWRFRIIWLLLALEEAGELRKYDCTLVPPEETTQKSPFWRQVMGMRFGHKFALWEREPGKLVPALFQQLNGEFGSRVRVDSAWTPCTGRLDLNIV